MTFIVERTSYQANSKFIYVQLHLMECLLYLLDAIH